MAIKVSLPEVVDALDNQMNNFTPYLNRQTGEIHFISDDDEAMLELEDDPEDLPEWQQEARSKAREVLESEDWLSLPTKFDIHEWEIMDRFSRACKVGRVRDELQDAIHGSGAFRFFKQTIHRHGMQDAWDQFRTAAIEEIAIEWLDEHKIAYTRVKRAESEE